MAGTLEFTKATLPSHAEFLQLLAATREEYDPVEKLLALDRGLIAFKQKYGMPSAEFFQRFEAGELGDALDFIRWAGCYELYIRLKQMISASLDVVVTETRSVYA